MTESLSATLCLSTTCSAPSSALSNTSTKFTFLSPGGVTVRESSLPPSDELTEWEFTASEIELWWSVGLGAQPLYTVIAELLDAVRPFTAVNFQLEADSKPRRMERYWTRSPRRSASAASASCRNRSTTNREHRSTSRSTTYPSSAVVQTGPLVPLLSLTRA